LVKWNSWAKNIIICYFTRLLILPVLINPIELILNNVAVNYRLNIKIY